jgi:N-6 DNA methylase
MATLSNDDKPYAEVVAGLREIGYDGGLLLEDYAFRDYFMLGMDVRRINAVAFGQTPVSYDSACIGVVCTNGNGLREQALVNQYRALGAPFILEIDKHEVREWAISSKEDGHGLVERYSIDNIREMFVSRASDWKPEPLLRAKNIGSFHWTTQLSLFAGLLPELEGQIQSKLEPLLHETLSTTEAVYKDVTGRVPEPSQLFKLIFWLLTAKVFHDRRVNGFVTLGASDPDALLDAVARRHLTDPPRLLNRQAREIAATLIWTTLDFRHLSVEVLSQMWAGMLIDDETKRDLGIQRTSRTIVRYIVEHVLPAVQPGDDKRIILEPCSGSAVFLIGAMNYLRPKLFLMNPSERHQYFVKHLEAIETDPFGVEISRLALTLADFPNPNNWEITHGDVFEHGAMTNALQRAGVVFCNPPFRDFDEKERKQYKISSPKKPVELLQRVLDGLHPSGVLGFVLPRNMIDGQGYKAIRKRLAERFASLELTVLPDRAFEADSEVGLLVATEPIPHRACRVTHLKVNDTADAWRKFELRHEISAKYETNFDPDQAEESLAIPDLPEIWDFLSHYPTLQDFADIHRGMQWNKRLTIKGKETGHRKELVRETPEEGFMLGVAPKTKLHVFETPHLYYLSRRPLDQESNQWKYDWEKPKAILNKAARSRGHWRMAAFPDTEGVICYQTYTGVWPKSDEYDEWLLSAILNAPLANAFVAAREGKTDITRETLNLIPFPYFTESQKTRLRSRITRYQKAIAPHSGVSARAKAHLLMEIDAIVLDAYMMPPELENLLLNAFRGEGDDRRTSHAFGDYLPPDCEVYFSLSEHLSPEFDAATSGELLRRTELVS